MPRMPTYACPPRVCPTSCASFMASRPCRVSGARPNASGRICADCCNAPAGGLLARSVTAIPARPERAVATGPARDPVVEVRAHRGIRRLERALTPVPPVRLIWYDEPERLPRRCRAAAAIRLECGLTDVTVVLVARREQRHLARRALRVAHVLKQLRVQPPHVEHDRRRARRELRVPRPRILLVDRRVRDDAGHRVAL